MITVTFFLVLAFRIAWHRSFIATINTERLGFLCFRFINSVRQIRFSSTICFCLYEFAIRSFVIDSFCIQFKSRLYPLQLRFGQW